MIHGHWIDKLMDRYKRIESKCSECGWWGISDYDGYVDIFDFNYCPNCGARMDGDVSDKNTKHSEKTKILYVCNTDKNIKCDKTSCYINGGECRLTSNKEFAKIDDNGNAVQNEVQEWYEKMIKGDEEKQDIEDNAYLSKRWLETR